MAKCVHFMAVTAERAVSESLLRMQVKNQLRRVSLGGLLSQEYGHLKSPDGRSSTGGGSTSTSGDYGSMIAARRAENELDESGIARPDGPLQKSTTVTFSTNNEKH